ncbi:chlorophyll(ide) b reductase [Marinobacter daqiaonensis]|uniref:Chlorophyll(Ide) b reductase n=1 Tax=Marinobacter daqiaonensis TaxID=650891 RepID=A0A1I6I5L1_9GAMM|nr:SDR family oxidoreductase [Marinobacter daqiaonensis]SFR62015.1 chlorophyll(ide) b reductase [Marinobacter daqiaonensis]
MWTLIAGAGSGIGRALAHELARDGHHLIIAGRTRDKLEAVAAGLREQYPDRVVWVAVADFSRPDDVARLASHIAGITGAIHRLVYCAGDGEPAADVESWDVADLNRALAVNVAAPLQLIQGLMPLLYHPEKAARVVMLGAGMDQTVQKGTGSYGVSKMALRRLVRQLAVEFDASPEAPVISLFQPGMVDTDGLRAHASSARSLGLPHASWLTERLDNGDCLTPEQAASAIAFTLKDVPESDFHGAVFHGRELVDSLSFAGS